MSTIHFDQVKQSLLEDGAAFVAAADLTPVDEDARSGMPVGISIGLALTPNIIAGIVNGPTPEYAGEYERANQKLAELALKAASMLGDAGFKAIACQPSSALSGLKRLNTPLPHKTVAVLAGVGWIGKCALLITKKWGSAIRLNTVLTDAPLLVGKPMTRSLCGKCELCHEACPSGAVSGRTWEPGMQREEFYDAEACRDCASRLGVKAGSSKSICGICIASCPFTRKYLDSADK
jgi:epoxyqueuosine reductase